MYPKQHCHWYLELKYPECKWEVVRVHKILIKQISVADYMQWGNAMEG